MALGEGLDEKPESNQQQNKGGGKGKEKNASQDNEDVSLKLAEQQIEIERLRGELRKKEIKETFSPQLQSAVGGNQGMSPEAVRELVMSVMKGMKDGPSNVVDDDTPVGEDDYDEIGTPFWSYMAWNIIASDVRRGREHLPPRAGTNANRLIIFETEFSRPIQSGKQQEVLIVSKFVSHSKRLTQWLRDHSAYGKTHFEKIGKAFDAGNVQMARFISQMYDWVKSLDNGAVAKHCVDRGIPASADPDAMRHTLVMAVVNERYIKLNDGRVVDRVDHFEQNMGLNRMNSMNAEALLDKPAEVKAEAEQRGQYRNTMSEVPIETRATLLSSPNRIEG